MFARSWNWPGRPPLPLLNGRSCAHLCLEHAGRCLISTGLLAAETEFELACDEYIPAIIFLRAAFGDQCWHNPTAGAGIVIDDPLLKKKNGFIDFEKFARIGPPGPTHTTSLLRSSLGTNGAAASEEVKLFLDYSDCFSICVHGCDHTQKRIRVGRLRWSAAEKLCRPGTNGSSRPPNRPRDRMRSVMVCPQEKYSLEAMGSFLR